MRGFIASAFVSTAWAFPTEDLIQTLPGVDGPLPVDWYSGYLDYYLESMNQTIHTHYIYVGASKSDVLSSSSSTVRRLQAAQDEDTPLIFWSNGGPGASSLFGLLTEVGPYVLNDDSLLTESYNQTGVPTLFENPYSWNKFGSLLIFDAPAPVGYSYCNDKPKGDGLSCGGWNDDTSAENNYQALLAFYKKFPSLQSKTLYLTGESYAGIYIPALAREILRQENTIPLKGFAVGDACAGFELNCGNSSPFFYLLFMVGHGQISMKLHDLIMAACSKEELEIRGHDISEKCQELLDKARNQVGGFYAYSLYDDCTYRNGILKGAVNDYVCGGGPVMEQYIRLPEVMESLHIPAGSNWFDGDNGAGFNYTPTEPNLSTFYNEVTKGRFASRAIRVMVYNGDTDPSLNVFQAQNWTSHLGLEEVEEWTPWTLDGCRRMGGYVTRYDGLFDFLTIRGAGHMVPTYKPEATFAFLKAWLNDEPYPPFDPDCTHP